ncbi:MAG TPA: hypothetical protein VHM91_13770, partial [Verrucomicrobiales bacterium]|nr:hypothetical protein [Verrucomicrobiales bacterium]
LSGNGTLAAAASVTSGGTLSPGASVGTLNFGSTLTLAAGSTYAAEITGAATNDKVVVTGTLTASGGIAVTLSGYTPVAGDSFDLADASAISGSTTFDFSAAVLGAGLSWDTSSFSTDGKIKVIAGNAYADWAALHGLTGPDADRNADPDGDGANNLSEFALNGDPKSGIASGKLRAAIATVSGSSVFTLTLPVRSGIAFSGATELTGSGSGVRYHVQGSDDLSTWTLDVDEVTPALSAGMPALDAGWTYRTFRTPGPVSADNRDYLRVGIESAP